MTTLAALLARGPLPIDAAIEIAREVLSALAALHREGIVHRDIKPENIVVHLAGKEPCVKLIDLGVCSLGDDPDLEPGERAPRITLVGAAVGTAWYMAPEQVRGASVSAATDLYALGMVLYETLTGHTAFEHSNVAAVARSVLVDAVPDIRRARFDCPASLDALVQTALSRDPAARPASASTFAAALAHIAEVEQLATGDAALSRMLSQTGHDASAAGGAAREARGEAVTSSAPGPTSSHRVGGRGRAAAMYVAALLVGASLAAAAGAVFARATASRSEERAAPPAVPADGGPVASVPAPLPPRVEPAPPLPAVPAPEAARPPATRLHRAPARVEPEPTPQPAPAAVESAPTDELAPTPVETASPSELVPEAAVFDGEPEVPPPSVEDEPPPP